MRPTTTPVTSTFDLPVHLLGHVQVVQNYLQAKADRAGIGRQISMCDALAQIIHNHMNLSMAGGRHDMMPTEFAAALYLGDLTLCRRVEAL